MINGVQNFEEYLIDSTEGINTNGDIILGDIVGSGYARPDDVMLVKGGMAALGYYQIPDLGMTPYFDNNLRTAIHNFQAEMELPITGKMESDSLSLEAMNEALNRYPGGARMAAQHAYEGSVSFGQNSNIDPNQSLVFDGKTLTVYENGVLTHQWGAVSGRPGYQDPSDQGEKDKGPLPEGMYLARQSRYQEWKGIDFINKVKGVVGRGIWPGNTESWGEQRVWLEPSDNTDTMGRGGFSIHGGSTPGSAGCIDLTEDMSDFAQWYRNNGKDVVIHVKY